MYPYNIMEPITNDNIHNIVKLYMEKNENIHKSYGPIHSWDVSRVKIME